MGDTVFVKIFVFKANKVTKPFAKGVVRRSKYPYVF